MLVATFIGEPVLLIVVALSVAYWGHLRHQTLVVVAASLALLAFAGNTALKHLYQRNRPDTMFVQHMKIQSYSFPSGHAFGSVVVLGLLASLLVTRLDQPWSSILGSALALLVILIGVSRVYLGAHFPTDVLAGWLLGSLSLFFIIAVVAP
jgi:membrane-associated phospholipid phosphatase